MQAVPQVQTAWTSSMDTITSTSTNTSTFYYLKWVIVVVILGYLAYILYPYLSIFVKLVELIRAFLMKAFKTKDVEPLDVGAKLAENKQEKKQAEANQKIKFYCYNCKFHFGRKKDFYVRICPNCGSTNFVEEDRMVWFISNTLLITSDHFINHRPSF